MSTFSGLNTAMTGLNAARLAMETAGNNLANVGTAGYTRQRADFISAGPVASTGMLASRPGVGQGVALTGIARLADAHLDARVRGTVALAAQSDTRAEALSDLEGILREPGENGLSTLLNDFWAGWEDVANQPGASAPAAVLLERAKAVVNRIGQSRTEISDQWASQRQSLDTMVNDVNAAASAVAGLNAQIRASIAAGGAPNALLDQRAVLIAEHCRAVRCHRSRVARRHRGCVDRRQRLGHRRHGAAAGSHGLVATWTASRPRPWHGPTARNSPSPCRPVALPEQCPSCARPIPTARAWAVPWPKPQSRLTRLPWSWPTRSTLRRTTAGPWTA